MYGDLDRESNEIAIYGSGEMPGKADLRTDIGSCISTTGKKEDLWSACPTWGGGGISKSLTKLSS